MLFKEKCLVSKNSLENYSTTSAVGRTIERCLIRRCLHREWRERCPRAPRKRERSPGRARANSRLPRRQFEREFEALKHSNDKQQGVAFFGDCRPSVR